MDHSGQRATRFTGGPPRPIPPPDAARYQPPRSIGVHGHLVRHHLRHTGVTAL